MNILHFSLGLPPYRSGGLTKYATDLMIAQADEGANVSLLYPGDFTFWKSRKISIVDNSPLNNLKVFEIQNPPLVPLLHGIKVPAHIYNSKPLDQDKVSFFFDKVRPDVFHVHTLMGLPVEIIDFFKKKAVKIVFSTHDYYGLCPKVNFINHENELCPKSDPSMCAICNKESPRKILLDLRNSKYILNYKSKLSKHVDINKASTITNTSSGSVESRISLSDQEEYGKLLDFYRSMFSKFDLFHFNSHLTESVYRSYLNIKNGIVLPITHNSIKDRRKDVHLDSETLKLGFIGSTSYYKGFPMLKNALCDLVQENYTNWTLDVWGGKTGNDEDCSKIAYRGKYTESELGQVFRAIDLLIVPSVWKETFSFITLEALSYGIPVLLTENVGAKDIVKIYDQEFVIPVSKNALKNKLKSILTDNGASLKLFNQKVLNQNFNYQLNEHVRDIYNLYVKMLKGI